jgi:hypothetical protein
MAFEKIREKADKLKGAAHISSEAAMGKIDELIDEFNEAVPDIKALGFSVHNFRMDIGALPEINAKIVGSVDAMDSVKIHNMVESNQEKKVLVSILRGLEAASHAKDKLGALGFKGVEADIKLGLPPKISIDFIQ